MIRRVKIDAETQARIYGWPVSADRREPAVFLGIDGGALSAHFTMTPHQARELAVTLIEAADYAEQQQKEAA
jgi:hypothetical protein